MMEKVATKHCNKCSTTKPTSEFGKHRLHKDGLQSNCKVCKKLSNKNYQEKNKSKISLKNKKYYQGNKDEVLARNKSWRDNNPGKLKEIKANYYNSNKEAYLKSCKDWAELNRPKVRAINSRWKKNNPDKVCAEASKRRARKLNATPPWLTEDQQKAIVEVYTHARDCELVSGESYHVDHIIPLQGKNVCGLHVPWNLQVLPADVNIAKGNRYED